MIYVAEYTDTYGGEVNYSWVKRKKFAAHDGASVAYLVRAAKNALGVVGRHEREVNGDSITVRPRGEHTIIFINPDYEAQEEAAS